MRHPPKLDQEEVRGRYRRKISKLRLQIKWLAAERYGGLPEDANGTTRDPSKLPGNPTSIAFSLNAPEQRNRLDPDPRAGAWPARRTYHAPV